MLAYANFSSTDYPATDLSGNDPLDIRNAIFTYMEPLLKKNNFVFSHGENSVYVFQHLTNPRLSVSFTVKSGDKQIRCDLSRGNEKDLMANYPLSLFVQGNSCFKGIKNDGFWYYNSYEDLIAVLEEQADLLAQFGFQWLFDHLNMEFEEC